MPDELRIPFGILLQVGAASRYLTIRNTSTQETYPKSRKEHISNSAGFIEIDCSNFTSGFSRGNVIRFSGNGISDIQIDFTIPEKGTTGSVRLNTTGTTRYSGGL